MIRFDLACAHPSFVPPIRKIVGDLAARYPQAPLREVRLYEPKPGDRSMANTTAETIALNPYWFSRPISDLRDAATWNTQVRLRGHVVEWHGGMTDEPRHVLIHEFGHSLSHALSGWRALAGRSRSRALADPSLAVSGYGLSNDDEWFAEHFALVELGLANKQQIKELNAILDCHI